MKQFMDIPADTLPLILSYLDVTSFVRSSLVSRLFNSVVNSSQGRLKEIVVLKKWLDLNEQHFWSFLHDMADKVPKIWLPLVNLDIVGSLPVMGAVIDLTIFEYCDESWGQGNDDALFGRLVAKFPNVRSFCVQNRRLYRGREIRLSEIVFAWANLKGLRLSNFSGLQTDIKPELIQTIAQMNMFILEHDGYFSPDSDSFEHLRSEMLSYRKLRRFAISFQCVTNAPMKTPDCLVGWNFLTELHLTLTRSSSERTKYDTILLNVICQFQCLKALTIDRGVINLHAWHEFVHNAKCDLEVLSLHNCRFFHDKRRNEHPVQTSWGLLPLPRIERGVISDPSDDAVQAVILKMTNLRTLCLRVTANFSIETIARIASLNRLKYLFCPETSDLWKNLLTIEALNSTIGEDAERPKMLESLQLLHTMPLTRLNSDSLAAKQRVKDHVLTEQCIVVPKLSDLTEEQKQRIRQMDGLKYDADLSASLVFSNISQRFF